MIQVYINYPNPHMTIHKNNNDPVIQAHNAPLQRKKNVTPSSLESVIEDFCSPMFVFRAEQGFNDVWLKIDFGDVNFEIEVAKYLFKILGKRYTPLRGAEIIEHC